MFNVRSNRSHLVVSKRFLSDRVDREHRSHVAVSDIRRGVSEVREEVGGQVRSVSTGCAQSTNRRTLTAA